MFIVLGNRVPLHCTGCGKVLPAYQPDSVVASIVAEEGLPRSLLPHIKRISATISSALAASQETPESTWNAVG